MDGSHYFLDVDFRAAEATLSQREFRRLGREHAMSCMRWPREHHAREVEAEAFELLRAARFLVAGDELPEEALVRYRRRIGALVKLRGL
jgi:hypothetical protein